MPDGGSQSPITMRLNLLASRRLRDAALRERLLAVLQDPNRSVQQIATSPLDGTTIAVRPREQTHVRNWPPEQLDLLRTAVRTAVEQGRPTFYDWQREDTGVFLTIRDNGEGVFITFKSPPDV